MIKALRATVTYRNGADIDVTFSTIAKKPKRAAYGIDLPGHGSFATLNYFPAKALTKGDYKMMRVQKIVKIEKIENDILTAIVNCYFTE